MATERRGVRRHERRRPARATSPATLLEATGVTKRFSGITALDSVTLDVEAGEAVGLIGPNGAGKTTFFNCLLGMLRPDGGGSRFDGRDITRLPVYRRARLGFGRTFQRIELFTGMSVREHLLVAERARRGDGGLWKDLLNLGRPNADEQRAAQTTLDLLGLDDVADRPVESLSLGRGRLVEIGRALMTEPLLLLLDEPSSGSTTARRWRWSTRCRRCSASAARRSCSWSTTSRWCSASPTRLYVLDFGTLIASGPTDEVMGDAAVRRAYLGDLVMSADRTRPAAPLLELRDVSAAYGPFRALFGVSLAVPEGKAVALLGSNGAGKTTIARVVLGPAQAHVRAGCCFEGDDVTGQRAYRLARLGIMHAPEGRSVFASLTVEENLALGLPPRGRARRGARRARAGLRAVPPPR